MCKWNCDTGLVVGEPWKSNEGRIHALALSPDGKMIACMRDGSVQLWTTDGEMMEGIWTDHSGWMLSLSWSPSGSQIASGSNDGTIFLIHNGKGGNKTICVWNTKTSELVVGPIQDLGLSVTSIVWSSDSTELYSANQANYSIPSSMAITCIISVALSPKRNVLLWDTESHQPIGQPFHSTRSVTILYGGDDKKLTVWMVKDMAPQLSAPTILFQQSDRQSTQEQFNSSLLSCLDADATGGDAYGFIEEAHARHFWKGISRRCPPPDESFPERSNLKRKFLARRVRLGSSLESATMKHGQQVREGEGKQCVNVDDRGSGNDLLSTGNDQGKRRDYLYPDSQKPPSDDPPPPTQLDNADDRTIWKRLMRSRGKDSTSVEITPTIQRPEVVEVSAVRGFQRLVVMKRVRKAKLPESTSLQRQAPRHQVVMHSRDPSSQAGSAQPCTSSLVSVQAGPSSYAMVGRAVQSSQAAPSSHFPTPRPIAMAHADYYADSSSSIEGSCNKFLDKICFPRGHFH
ncbi:WD40 repeat-like protein [Suillus weaverae]|nr:WD40 repeat-like protein [Suillus weaverae]